MVKEMAEGLWDEMWCKCVIDRDGTMKDKWMQQEMEFGLSRKVLLEGIFFFSSRRRHTRSLCDWSSDVCSSDLEPWARLGGAPAPLLKAGTAACSNWPAAWSGGAPDSSRGTATPYCEEKPCRTDCRSLLRSEERRVGKGCGLGWWTVVVKRKERT